MKKQIQSAILIVIGIVLFFAVLYGAYWIIKTFSYWLFYEDMVRESIRQMVKPEYLRQ